MSSDVESSRAESREVGVGNAEKDEKKRRRNEKDGGWTFVFLVISVMQKHHPGPLLKAVLPYLYYVTALP